MRIDEWLAVALPANAGIAAIAGTRIWNGEVPDYDAIPAVSYFAVTGDPDYTLSGANGFRRVRIQITCFADDVLVGNALARAVETLLSGYRGTGTRISDGATINIQSCLQDSWRDLSSDESGQVSAICQIAQDYLIQYIEGTP